MIGYVIPTRNRPGELAQTLAAIERLGTHDALGGAEIVVVDNASDPPVALPPALSSGVGVKVVRMEENGGAASRNAGALAADPRCEWIVMLDDDSHPLDLGLAEAIRRAHPSAAAVAADIFLPRESRREDGGLPEVFVGCGVALRRRCFLGAGGYDPTFGFYAEEYDLAARLLLAGWRVSFDPWFRVAHRKEPRGRDMDLIVSRLVRNGGWVVQRYAPPGLRRRDLREHRRRCRFIAQREGALAGYAAGLGVLRATGAAQPRTPLTMDLYDRFTGLAAAREGIGQALAERPFASAAIVCEGKNAWVVRQALREAGVRIVAPREAPEALVIGTMSPGPMLDAFERLAVSGERIVAPWTIPGRFRAHHEHALTGGEPLAQPGRRTRIRVPA